MTVFLIIMILLLLGWNYVQYKSSKEKKENLVYMYQKINKIVNNETSEKVLLATSDEELKILLIEINRLLEHNQRIIATFNRTEDSMRKMLSNISHDIKTPLTVVLGYMEVILHDTEMHDEERNALLLKMQNKTIEVIDLMNKFFDLAKIESGDKDIPLTRINMNELCRKNILSFYEILTTKGIQVGIEIPEMDLYALGHEEELDRILNNLLSNAIRYGSDGNIIGLVLRDDNGSVYVDVWDKGKGINTSYKDQVFERMYTLEDSRNKQYQGSGLGLTITKRLVEKMGGEISLTSIPYEKTTFTVKLNKMNF